MKRSCKDSERKFHFFLLMILTWCSVVYLILYIPVFGNIVAFKDYHITGVGFIDSVMKSKWVSFDNFKFLFSSKMPTLLQKYGLGRLGLSS